MDNRKNFHRIVLLFIFVLIVVISLMISRMSGENTQKTEDSAVNQTEEMPSAASAGEDLQDTETLSQESETAPPRAEDEEEGKDDNGGPSAQTDEAVEEARRKREEDERYAEYRRKLARESREKSRSKEDTAECEEPEEEQEPEEEPYVPPTIMIASDLHYMSSAMHDSGEAFTTLLLEDDGKLTHCSDLIVEALIDEAISRGVSALVMAGDNTFNGERENHEELARRLRRLTDAGIAVLLVPGNHDINDTNAAYYFGDEATEAEYLHSADEYYEIYEIFYEGANSRDPNSLSYVYPLDATHWIMLLDSAWYEDRMHVEGRIREETLEWMEEVFEAAEEAGAVIIPVAHHNLLSESRVYTKECILRNYDEVTELLEAHHIPLYLSGHLHAQRIKKHRIQPGVSDEDYGITEIVSSSVSIAPCQYGILSWDDDDAMHYEVFSLVDHMDEDGGWLDIGAVAEEEEMPEDGPAVYDVPEDQEGQESEETFALTAIEFTKAIISNQISAQFPSLPEDVRKVLGDSYADMYYLYCSGSYIDWDEFTHSRAYSLWQKYEQPSEQADNIQEMRAMAQDNSSDYHTWDHP